MTDRLGTQGYALILGLLDQKWISDLKREKLRFSKNNNHSLSVEVQLDNKSAVIREFVTNGPQLALVIEILGPNICFTHQQFVTKRADSAQRTDIPWHQDSGYGELRPPRDLTVWIALDDCGEENGCLWVLPGSQDKGLQPHRIINGLLGADVEGEGVPLPRKAGDAVVFNSLLMHRSSPNETDKRRVAMYVRYCDPSVRMMVNEGKPVLEDDFSWMVAGESS